jgi:hypothetical protein
MASGPQHRSAAGALGSRPEQPPEPPRRRGRGAALLAGLVLAAGVAALTLVLLSGKGDREHREAAEQRRVVAAERARLRRIQAPHRARAAKLRPPAGAGADERLRARTALYDAARASILADARRRAASGELAGPISAVTCTPLASAPESRLDHLVLTRRIGRYNCLAVKRGGDGGRVALGHPFVAALDFGDYGYVWCRNSPKPGEAGEALAFVRLDRACLAARGRAIGTGYAATPGDG